ncbi:MAG: hypothetical protein WDM88_03945 [Galbitalea sp.]
MRIIFRIRGSGQDALEEARTPAWPTSISGIPKNASSSASRTSQQEASTKPAPSAAPLMAPITGFALSSTAKKHRTDELICGGLVGGAGIQFGLLFDVGARAEDRATPGEDDRADLVTLADIPHGREQFLAKASNQRVDGRA